MRIWLDTVTYVSDHDGGGTELHLNCKNVAGMGGGGVTDFTYEKFGT